MANFKKIYKIVPSCIPSIIAIVAAETINVVMFKFGPIKDSIVYLLLWLVLQFLSGLIFAYISDQHFRKLALIWCQVFGVISGIILSIFDLQLFVMIIIGISFNPLPVARATLLDNFPKHSSLRIIAFTFIAQYAPWALFRWTGQINYKFIIWAVLIALAINILLTHFLLKDKYDDEKECKNKLKFREVLHLIVTSKPLLFTLLAFILAESSFYLLMDYFEYMPQARSYFSIASFSTLLGFCISALWNAIPHKSIIAFCYLIGCATSLAIIFNIIFVKYDTINNALVLGIGVYAIVGGVYLPLVVDMFIKLLGSKHRAVGASLAELGDTVASFVGPASSLVTKINPLKAAGIFSFFFLFAAIFQKMAEARSFLSKKK